MAEHDRTPKVSYNMYVCHGIYSFYVYLRVGDDCTVDYDKCTPKDLSKALELKKNN